MPLGVNVHYISHLLLKAKNIVIEFLVFQVFLCTSSKLTFDEKPTYNYNLTSSISHADLARLSSLLCMNLLVVIVDLHYVDILHAICRKTLIKLQAMTHISSSGVYRVTVSFSTNCTIDYF